MRNPALDGLRAFVVGRVTLSLALGLACAVVTWATRSAIDSHGGQASDFAQLWYAARAWRYGMNPYDVVGPGRAFPWPFPLLYPLPAVIVAVPFSFLPVRLAEALFLG